MTKIDDSKSTIKKPSERHLRLIASDSSGAKKSQKTPEQTAEEREGTRRRVNFSDFMNALADDIDQQIAAILSS